MEMIRQMFATYGKELTPDALKGYLAVTSRIPLRSMQPCIVSAMENTKGGFPPGPGDVVREWRARAAQNPHVSELPQEARGQLGAGPVAAQLEASLGGLHGTDAMMAIAQRARDLRKAGEKVPKDWHEGWFLSMVCAALELEHGWPLTSTARGVLSERVRRHEEKGGDGAWWWKECRSPTLTSRTPSATVRDSRLT
jgi:hypothetical protein